MGVRILRLLLCGAVFFAGSYLAGAIAAATGVEAPALAPGEDAALSRLYALATAPLMALSIILVARGITGPFIARTVALSFLVWIAYSVTNELEGLVFVTYSTAFWSAILQAVLPSLLCAAAAATLFPSDPQGGPQTNPWKAFFSRRPLWDWIWRLVIASLAFAPVYFLVGLLVLPLIGDYYQQNVGGLQQPDIGRLFSILPVRSVLFFVACLPVMSMWNKSQRSLFLSLGFGLAVWVGLLYLLSAYWLPVNLRLIHAVEILADEFLYTGILLWLLPGLPQRKRNGREVPQVAKPGCFENSQLE